MCNLGPYQKLVMDAYDAGGPDIWRNKLESIAYNAGAQDMKNKLLVPVLFVGICIGTAIPIAYSKMKNGIEKKKIESLYLQAEMPNAKTEIKQNTIKAVDKTAEESEDIIDE